ncbi:ABC transporter substrate-binding protein [Streptomyces bikiniensis]|uniref:ABC transporter substrate-binding protein n=1 Tax=Streptomyces bikiniensis TaxID=1896 RepID=A0ABW8CLC3_STRBI
MTPPTGPGRRRLLRLATAGLLCAAALTGCVGTGGDAPGDDSRATGSGAPGLRVGVAPNVVLDAVTSGLRTDGALAAAAGPVTFTELRGPDEIRTRLTSGSVDVLTLPANIAANLHSRGVDVRVLGVVDGPSDVLLGPASKPASWSSLRGATVHIPFKGDVNDVVFRRLAERNGLKPGEDLTIVHHPALPDLLTAVGSGRAEYALLPEHQATLAAGAAARAGTPRRPVLDLGGEWRRTTGQTGYPTYAVGVRGAYADRHPALVKEVDRALRASAKAAPAPPREVTAGIAGRTKVPPATVADLLERLSPGYRPASAARAELDALFRELATAAPALLGGRVPDAGLYAAPSA